MMVSAVRLSLGIDRPTDDSAQEEVEPALLRTPGRDSHLNGQLARVRSIQYGLALVYELTPPAIEVSDDDVVDVVLP